MVLPPQNVSFQRKRGTGTVEVALDWDGVVVDTGKLEGEIAERYFGARIPPERRKAYLVDPTELSEREYRAVTLIASYPEHGLSVQPVDGALEHIPLLQAAEHRLRIATARDGDLLEVARQWSARRELQIPFFGTGHQQPKTPSLTGVDLFVDDDVNQLVLAEKVVPHRILFSQPYNQHVVLPRGIIRVADWPELYETIQCIRYGSPRRRVTVSA